jgi:hypothetical protein
MRDGRRRLVEGICDIALDGMISIKRWELEIAFGSVASCLQG